MQLYDDHLGNLIEDDDVASRVEAEGARRLTLDETTRRRSRFRATADDGTDIGVVAAAEGSLEPGDVLAGDDGLLVVSLADRNALVVDFGDVTPTAERLARVTELGHAVGNRHRELAVRGDEVLVAVDDEERQRAELDEHLPAGATVRVEAVDPTRFDDETPAHDHGASGHTEGHTHAHEDGGHGHSHDGHRHTHAGVRTPDGRGDDER